MRLILIFLSLLGPFKTFADSAGCDLVYRYDSLRSQTISAELQRAGLDVLEANLAGFEAKIYIVIGYSEQCLVKTVYLSEDFGADHETCSCYGTHFLGQVRAHEIAK